MGRDRMWREIKKMRAVRYGDGRLWTRCRHFQQKQRRRPEHQAFIDTPNEWWLGPDTKFDRSELLAARDPDADDSLNNLPFEALCSMRPHSQAYLG